MRLLRRLKRQDRSKTIIFTSFKCFSLVQQDGTSKYTTFMALVASDGRAMMPVITPVNVKHDPTTYQKVLLRQVLPWIRRRYRPGTWVLQQDYGFKSQTSQSTRYFLEKSGIGHWTSRDYPTMSSNLNPLNAVWDKVSKMLHAKDKSHVNILNVWRRLSRSYLRRICSKFRANVEMLVESKGNCDWNTESKTSEQNNHSKSCSSAKNKSEKLSESEMLDKMETQAGKWAFEKMLAITSNKKGISKNTFLTSKY